jgi:trehalose 6-phosphate synthase/phosphatase
MGRTIIVSNRLPLRVQKKDGTISYKSSVGGLATGLGSIYKKNNNLWIGWPGIYLYGESDKDYVRKALFSENMVPVFLTKKEIKEYYEGFSNETLWPTFHYFPQYSIYEKAYWDAYVKVNLKFCNEILKVVKPGDTLWIHDYQLLLLPMMIREKIDVNIGFFLHIPFPSSEIFRLLPWREEILRGMLGADLLGFHTVSYMRHFLDSVAGILGVNNSGGLLEIDQRIVLADAFPMGIDYEKYEHVARSKRTAAIEKRYRKSITAGKVMLSIDRLDYSKGIPGRLIAFEQFLKNYPEFREKVSLVQVLVPSRDKVASYKALKEEISRLVGNINSAYGTLSWTPVYYLYRSFPLEVLSAFYSIADVAVVTPMRDGMNLVCKEYIASRIDKRGALILSEMAGASIELPDAIIVNPNDINQLVQAFYTGLTMSPREQERRIEAMQAILRKFNIHHWVKLFMDRLGFVIGKQRSLSTRTMDKELIRKLKQVYSSSKRRLIFLDYDGTLVSFRDEPRDAHPDKELIDLLKRLGASRNNRVVLISGRNKESLDKWFGKLNIDLIAEHGVWLKFASEPWGAIDSLGNGWKDEILPILEHYVDRTPQAFIEEKDYSLVWHYRKVELGLGELRTKELVEHLKYITASYNLQLLEGDMIVEVKNSEVNKGRAAMRWLEKYEPEFIIAIGDDWTDEDVFKVMPEHAVTVKVRSTVSAAKYNLKSYKEVRSFLKKLLQPAKPGVPAESRRK